ncbi:MAG: hypothetical protein JSS38_18540 [Nitrospira sp.]|nr:hypothetical protein [Nitrospira sp.]
MEVGDYGNMRCSSDLRQRVMDFVQSGGSKAGTDALRRSSSGKEFIVVIDAAISS